MNVGERAFQVILAHQVQFRSMTGPISGCSCGGLKLGQSFAWHVVDELSRAEVLREDPDLGSGRE